MAIVKDDNVVFTIQVFKMEPECLSYKTKVTAEYDSYKPEYLEQLHVLRGTLDALQEKAEGDNLSNWISQNREIREQLKKEREREEEKRADSGPKGGESEPC